MVHLSEKRDHLRAHHEEAEMLHVDILYRMPGRPVMTKFGYGKIFVQLLFTS
jgi:hypothetical protein